MAEKLSFFYYFVTSKGVILESRRVFIFEDGNPDKDLRTVEININPDFSYAPSMKVYAYFFHKSQSKIFSAILRVDFEADLPNHVS